MPDWTIALDDALTERLAHCSGCGRAPAVHLGLHVLPVGLAIATAVCRPCHTQDPQQGALGALLAARYHPARWQGPHPD